MIERPVEGNERKKRLYLAGKREPLVDLYVVKWFDPQLVASEEQIVPARIIYGKGKDTVQVQQQILTLGEVLLLHQKSFAVERIG